MATPVCSGLFCVALSGVSAFQMNKNYLPPYTDRTNRKNKKLYRSTGSFSVFEDNIVLAPTPQRKVALTTNSVPTSPISHRREKRRSGKQEESLFGEAGQELQTILLFSAPTTPTISDAEQEQFHEELMRELEFLRQSPCLSPPTRATNPVPMNSPFQGTAAAEAVKDIPAAAPIPKVKPTKVARPMKVKKIVKEKHPSTKKSYDLHRGRSKSWPSLSGMTSFELLVA